MTNLLNKIHQKPEHHKKALAFGVSLGITLMVFGIWISTLPGRINVASVVAKDTQKELEAGITPLATVKASFDEVTNSINEFRTGLGKGSNNEVQLETVVGN
jgi:hypothetical protein